MYTLDPKQMTKQTVCHIVAAVFLALFGAIYEYYSHEVYSYYMIYAFAIPLVFGALPYGIIALRGTYQPRAAVIRTWDLAIATYSVGSLFKGVLDIYGTTNRLIIVYPIAGGVLVLLSLVLLLRSCSFDKK